MLIFTLLAIGIACLGLFGLVTFTAEQRRKEIGIRKVLGSSVGSIIWLLARDLGRLLMLSVVIAVPVAWLMTHRWLEDFAYHVSPEWWIFASAALIAAAIAMATVISRAAKAGRANPVTTLRTE